MKIVKSEKITLRDIAKETGIGLGTVSRALSGTGYVSEDKKREIDECAIRLGYNQRPQKQEKTVKKQRIVGVVIPDISFPFYGSFLRYVEFELDRRSCHTMVFNTLGVQNKVGHIIELLEGKVLDGLIFNGDIAEREVESLKKYPVVSFERMLGKDIPMIASDHVEGGRLVAKLLSDKRCMNVLIITAKHKTAVYADKRNEECENMLKQNGAKVIRAEYDGEMASYRYIDDMIKQYLNIYHDIDAIFTEDVAAFYCVMYAKNNGWHIPEDVKIVGYDGNEMIRMITPQITTVSQNVSLLARKAAEIIVQKMNHEKVDSVNLVPVNLVEGGTT